MDWIWTDTSMTVMDWFKMEDIFANIYQIKVSKFVLQLSRSIQNITTNIKYLNLLQCMRGLESDYPQERGVKKTQMSKYMVGGGALFLMIGMIWFPLLLFALGSTVGISNLPFEVNLNIRIGSYEPIYMISAQNSSIFEYSEKNFDDLRELYEVTHRDRSAVTFLENYINTDVCAVKLSTESGRLWSISPPDKNRLIDELKSNNIVTIHVEWSIAKKPASKEDTGITTNTRDIRLEPYINGVINPVRKGLIEALNGGGNSSDTTANSDANGETGVAVPNDQLQGKSKSILLENVLPMFIKVTSRTTSVVPQLMRPLIQYRSKYKICTILSRD